LPNPTSDINKISPYHKDNNSVRRFLYSRVRRNKPRPCQQYNAPKEEHAASENSTNTPDQASPPVGFPIYSSHKEMGAYLVSKSSVSLTIHSTTGTNVIGTPFTTPPLSTLLNFNGISSFDEAGEIKENVPQAAQDILSKLCRVRETLPHHMSLAATDYPNGVNQHPPPHLTNI
jgi:hypothetical protein